jgi:uncharacterized membrane protein
MKKILLTLILLLTTVTPIRAQIDETQTSRGRIQEVNQVDCEASIDENYICYTYTVILKDNEKSIVTMPSTLESSQKPFKVGDSVYLTQLEDLDGENTWSITGYARGNTILICTLAFILLAIVIGGLRSLGSILSLIGSFIIIYFFIIPQIISTGKIVLIGYIGVFLILILGMYLSHGFRKLTSISLIATLVGVGIVSVLSLIVLEILNINGLGDETAFLLSSQMNGEINIKLLFFISILIGAAGVLDDVTIGQVSSMYEIYKANPKLTTKQLYNRTMNVGREHVSSMINTLFIVYAGSSLPLVVLMYLSNRDLETLISIDMISEEIARTLVISMSLLLVVPISTYISSTILTHQKRISQ